MLTSNKLKVLIIHNYYQIPGGEDSVVKNEKKMLEDYGHNVMLYSRHNNELKTMNILEKLVLPFTTIFSIKTYIEVKKIIKNKDIDIVHVHNTLNLISPSVYYAAVLTNTPVVQTIHNFRMVCPGAILYRDSEICEKCLNEGLKWSITNKCYRGSKLQTLACVITMKIHEILGIYKKINYICLTEFNKLKLLEKNKHNRTIIDNNKIFIKPNFVEKNEKNYIIPFNDRKNQYVFAGRLDNTKGIRMLLDAWKDITFADLIICGTGPEEEWCKNFVAKNNITNIKMLGFVSNINVKKIISESRALILPTQWYEGFPMTLVESFSCGTPVIGSDIGNVGSIIHNGVNGYKFKHNSVEALKKAIINLNDICDSTYEFYNCHYTKQYNYKYLYAIYKSILNLNR